MALPIITNSKAIPTETSSLLSLPPHHGEHDHSHVHGHEDDHDHSDSLPGEHVDGKKERNHPVLQRLKMATALCLTFMMVEVVGGYLAGSLAILSDAAHLMADLASFAVAITASYLAARPSTTQYTYGLKRTESLAALFSMVTLALLSIALALEALRRIYFMANPNTTGTQLSSQVDGRLMSGIATIGVLVNLTLAAVLGEHHTHLPGGGDDDHDHSHDHGHHEEKKTEGHLQRLHSDEVLTENHHRKEPTRNVNLHAAYLHVMADLAQSVAVLVAGLIIWWKPEWDIVDPIATILFCCLVFYSTLGVIRSAICVLLEEVPPHVSWQTLHDEITSVPHVTNVHDLHIWSISHGINAMSVHVKCNSSDQDLAVTNRVLKEIAQLAQTHGISHSTIQVQQGHGDADCITCVLGDEGQSCVF